MNYYVVLSLIDEILESIILDGGWNDLSDKNSTPEKIVNETGDIGELCRSYDMNDIFMSIIIFLKKK